MGINAIIFKSDFICKNIVPLGVVDCINLDFTTVDKFIPRTLEVFLDGDRLDSTDFNVNATSNGFSIILNPSDPNGKKLPPQSNEKVTVNYIKECN